MEQIMFGLIFTGLFAWTVWLAHEWWVARTRRILNQSIADGIVPVNYSKIVRMLATEQNAEACGFPTDEQERRFGDLSALRKQVGLIRLAGFDAARAAKLKGELFEQAIAANPYEKRSGAAQQWARGFCQAGGHPPKGWMKRA